MTKATFSRCIEETVADGRGVETSAAALLTVCGLEGAAFVDRPHKQPGPMAPVTVRLTDPALGDGRRIILDGVEVGLTSGGRCTFVIEKSGHHRWRIE